MGHDTSKYDTTGQQATDDRLTLKTPKRCISLTPHDEKINQFTLIWLDEKSNENSLDSLRTKTLLRQINNDQCLFFDDANMFLNEIEKMHYESKKMLVVISGSFAKTILPKTQETISTIIIFCGNYNKYTELTSRYWNVTDICTDHETLKTCI